MIFSFTEAGFKKISKTTEEDEDVDLCVDDDDADVYGKPQYPFHIILISQQDRHICTTRTRLFK